MHEANERHQCAMQSALQQSPHASVTRGINPCSKGCKITLSPNRKDLTTSHGRSYCALLAGEDVFFTATNGSSHIVSNHLLYHTQKHANFHGIKRFFTHCVKCTILKDIYNHISNIQTETYIFCVYIYIYISCPQGMSVTVIRTMPPSSSRCLAAMRATCKESGHAKKHAETCKHRLHKAAFYDRTAKTSSLFDLCASSNSKRAGTVSSSANLHKACLISSHGGSKSKPDTSLHELSVTTHVFSRWINNACSENRKESLRI